MPGFKGGWEDGSGRKCILKVSPLLPPSFQYKEGNELIWFGGIWGNIWINDLRAVRPMRGCVVWSRGGYLDEHTAEPWGLPGSHGASSYSPSCATFLPPAPSPGVFLAFPFQHILWLSGSSFSFSVCSVSSAQVPLERTGERQLWWLWALTGGNGAGRQEAAGQEQGLLGGEVWACLSGKPQLSGEGEFGLHRVLV